MSVNVDVVAFDVVDMAGERRAVSCFIASCIDSICLVSFCNCCGCCLTSCSSSCSRTERVDDVEERETTSEQALVTVFVHVV